MAEAAPTNPAFRRRRWYHRRDVRFVAVVAAVLILFYSHGFITGPDKISSALAEALAGDKARINIQVETLFAPEAFHMSVYQELGSMRGSEGTITTLHRVKPADVYTLSRKYWVSKIDLAAR
jgi:hypothetical protein